MTLLSVWVWDQTPRQASPEIVRDMQRQISDAAPATGAQTSAIRRDSAVTRAQLEVLIGQLNSMSEEMTRVKTDLASRDMSRVAVVEDNVRDILRDMAAAKDRADKQARQDHEDVMSWIRPITVAVITSLILGLGTLLVNHLRQRSIKRSLHTLEVQTNGMTEKIASLAHDVGYVKGLKEGREEGREG
jgi:hypothetical protein